MLSNQRGGPSSAPPDAPSAVCCCSPVQWKVVELWVGQRLCWPRSSMSLLQILWGSGLTGPRGGSHSRARVLTEGDNPRAHAQPGPQPTQARERRAVRPVGTACAKPLRSARRSTEGWECSKRRQQGQASRAHQPGQGIQSLLYGCGDAPGSRRGEHGQDHTQSEPCRALSVLCTLALTRRPGARGLQHGALSAHSASWRRRCQMPAPRISWSP